MSCSVTPLLPYLAGTAFAAKRVLSYLRYFQQEQYLTPRFRIWYKSRGAYDRRGSAAGLVGLAGAAIGMPCIASTIASLYLIWRTAAEENPIRSGKLPLKLTERAVRIAALTTVILLILEGVARATAWSSSSMWIFQILIFQAVPLMLIVANTLLAPYEKSIQDGYRDQAIQILRRTNPFTIGITGSYGKTSTKSIIAQILNTAVGPTYWPPKGVNSLMGIVRDIRERFVPGTKYAVIEMGAFNRGSIRRLCDFSPPNAAIVTAVGLMHLERFGSAENIYLAKSELAQAVPQDGILVCNGDNDGARRMAAEHKKATTLIYGLELDKGPVDAWFSEIKTTPEGMRFTAHWGGKSYPNCLSPQFGRPALSNILGAMTMACALGAAPESVLAVARSLDAVDNRLQIDRSGGMITLKDAYNSNPVGFAGALEILSELPGKRKILVTPGMVELGEKQFEENRRIAVIAAKTCDLVMVVSDTNRAAWVDGLRNGGLAEEKILIMADRTTALAKLRETMSEGDVILIENDLPDLYEGNLNF